MKLPTGLQLMMITLLGGGGAGACSSSSKTYPLSDHFDGRRFYCTPPIEYSWSEYLRAFTDRNKKAWPNWIAQDRAPLPQAQSDKLRLTFINHASFLIQWNGLNILTDPIFSERASPLSWVGPKRVRDPGVALSDLPKIDAVLLSHDHYDHLDRKSLDWLVERDQPLLLGGLGLEELFQDQGWTRYRTLDWMDSVSLGQLEIYFVPSQHFSGRGLFDRNRQLWGSFVLRSSEKSLYFAGDTAYGSHFQRTRERLGAVDIALLPIGTYEPDWGMRRVHMNPEDAVRAHLDLGARQSFGMHFGTFQLSDEAIDQPLRDLASAREKFGLKPDEFTTLDFGAAIDP